MAIVVTFYNQYMKEVRQDRVELEGVYHLIVPSSAPSEMLFYYSVDMDASDIEAAVPQEAGHAG